MAIAPALRTSNINPNIDPESDEGKQLLAQELAKKLEMFNTSMSSNLRAEDTQELFVEKKGIPYLSQYQAAANAVLLGVHRTLASPDSQFHDQIEEETGVRFPAINIGDRELNYQVGGRQLAAMRAFGETNKGSVPQNLVASTPFDGDKVAKLKMLFKPDGGMNASFVIYVEDSQGNALGDMNLENPKNKIIASNQMVKEYYQAVAISQEMRIQSGLAPDDILRDAHTGLPAPFFQGDTFYAMLPEAHPYHKATPFQEAENTFLRDFFIENYKQQIFGDHGSKLIAAADSNTPLETVKFDAANAKEATASRISFLMEQPEGGLSQITDEHRSINMHRSTDNPPSVVRAFLASDPTIQTEMRVANEELANSDPSRLLEIARTSDLNPNNIRYGNIDVDATAFDPRSPNYGNHNTNSQLLKVSNANFELYTAKDKDSVIVVQGMENRAVAETLLGTTAENLLKDNIMLTSTNHLDGLSDNTLVPRLRGLYKQVLKDRNNDKETALNPETAKQTLFLVDRATKSTLDMMPQAVSGLQKLNVAFIPPPAGIDTWTHFNKISEPPERKQYMATAIEHHEIGRDNLLAQDEAGLVNKAPKSKVSSVLDNSIKAFLIRQEVESEHELLKSKSIMSIEEKMEIFEKNNALIMSVLQNESVKKTLGAMMNFAKVEIQSSKFKPAHDALSKDLGVNSGFDSNTNAAVIGLVGKMLIDGYMRKNNADYLANPSDPKFDEQRELATHKISDNVLADENIDPAKRQKIAERVQSLISTFAKNNPEIDPSHTDRLLNIIELGAGQLRNQLLLGTPGVPSAAKAVENSEFGVNARPDISPLPSHMTEFSLDSVKGYSFFAAAAHEAKTAANTATNTAGLFGMSTSMASLALFASDEVDVPKLEVEAPAVEMTAAEALASVEEKVDTTPAFVIPPLSITAYLAMGIKSTPDFQSFAQSTLAGEAYLPSREVLIDAVPDLQHFNPIDQTDKTKNKLPRIDPEELTELGSAQPESAASKLNLVYTFSVDSYSSFGADINDMDDIELYAADYASRDDMMLSLFASNLENSAPISNFQYTLKSVESEALDENIADLYEDKLSEYFSNIQKADSADKMAPIPALDIDIHGMTVAEILAVNNAAPEVIAETVKLTEPDATTYSILKEGNVETFTLDGKPVPAYTSPEAAAPEVATTTQAPVAEAVTAQPAVVDPSNPIAVVASNPDFQKFMGALVENQINSENSIYASQLLDIKNTVKNTFPELADIDTKNIPSADPDSMVAQLGIQSAIYQRHGKIAKTPVDMTQYQNMETAVVAYMADNADYLNSQATIKLAVGKLETNSKDPAVQEMVQVMADRGMKVVHPDMFTMNTAQFADTHFPDQINGKQFDQYRDEPKQSVVSQTGLTLIVENEKGATREYDLSKFETPEALAAQQKIDFRQNENGIKIVDIRCHALAKDAVATIFDATTKAMDSYPQALPTELWAQDVKSYLKNDNVIEAGKFSDAQIDKLSSQAEAANKANLAGNPEPEFKTVANEDEKELKKPVTRELDSFEAAAGM